MEDKLNYCQQCHLHKSECRCESTYHVGQAENVGEGKKSIPIMLSNWTVSIKGLVKVVERVVVKDIGVNRIKKDETFLRRVRRELNTDDFEVISIEFTKSLGETVSE